MITIYDYSKLKVVKHFKLAKSYTWLTVHVNTTSNPPNKQGTQNKKSGFDINIERTLNHRMNVITEQTAYMTLIIVFIMMWLMLFRLIVVHTSFSLIYKASGKKKQLINSATVICLSVFFQSQFHKHLIFEMDREGGKRKIKKRRENNIIWCDN